MSVVQCATGPAAWRHTSGHACRAAVELQPPDSAGPGARRRGGLRVRAAGRARGAADDPGRERHPACTRSRSRASRRRPMPTGGRPRAARLAGQGGGRRRPLQHGRPGRHRRRSAPRHAADEEGGLAARRRAPGAGAGRHHLARPAGRARSARPVGAHDAELLQLHRRRRGLGQLPWPLRRPRPDQPLGAGAAAGAGRRPHRRGQPPGEPRAAGGRDRRLRRDRRDHRGRARPRRQHEDGAADRERAAGRVSEVLRRQGAERSRQRDAQRRPDPAAVRRAGGHHLAPHRQAGDAAAIAWCREARPTP